MKTENNPIIRFYRETDANNSRMLKLSRWVKKMSKYGVYMEVTENFDRTNLVELFSHKLYTDYLGNTAIKL